MLRDKLVTNPTGMQKDERTDLFNSCLQEVLRASQTLVYTLHGSQTRRKGRCKGR